VELRCRSALSEQICAPPTPLECGSALSSHLETNRATSAANAAPPPCPDALHRASWMRCVRQRACYSLFRPRSCAPRLTLGPSRCWWAAATCTAARTRRGGASRRWVCEVLPIASSDALAHARSVIEEELHHFAPSFPSRTPSFGAVALPCLSSWLAVARLPVVPSQLSIVVPTIIF